MHWPSHKSMKTPHAAGRLITVSRLLIIMGLHRELHNDDNREPANENGNNRRLFLATADLKNSFRQKNCVGRHKKQISRPIIGRRATRQSKRDGID